MLLASIQLICILLSGVGVYAALLVFGSIRIKVRFPIVIDFLAFFTFVNVFLWHVLPAFLRILSQGQHEKNDGILPFEILQVYTFELFSFLIFLLPFMAVFQIKSLNHVYLKSSSLQKIISQNRMELREFYRSYSLRKFQPHRSFTLFIILLGIYFELQKLILKIDAGLFPPIDWLLVPVVIKSSLILTIHQIFILNFYKKRLEPFLIFVTFFLILLLGAANGSHGSIFAPVLYLCFYNLFHNINKPTMYVGLFLFLFLALFYKEMHQVRALSSLPNAALLTPQEKLILIVSSDSAVTETHTPGSSFLDKVEWRFGENSRMSVGFIRMYENGNSAGLKPFENSLYLLPRAFYADKPIPGSVDGTALGLGMRLIHNNIRGTLWNMSGFFTGLHGYWEFGLRGVAMASFFSGIYCALVVLLCVNFKYLGLPLLIIMHDTWWWAIPKIWSYEISIQLFNLLLPFLFIWLAFKYSHAAFRNLKRQL